MKVAQIAQAQMVGGSFVASNLSRSQSVTSATGRDDMQIKKKRKKLPILTAKVTQQVQIETQNSDKLFFQIITKENGQFLKSTKRTYMNFRSLDEILTSKYSRQIRRGQLTKRELPPNLTSFNQLEHLRQQLNLYLQEIMRVKILPAQNVDGLESPENLAASPREALINVTLKESTNATGTSLPIQGLEGGSNTP